MAPGCGALDRDLERQQIGLAVRGRIDDRIEPMAVGLVAVEREVLERRDDALALDAIDGLGAEDRGVVRIFGLILEVSAVAHVAGEIDAAGQHHVEALEPRLAGDGRAPVAGELGIEARADDDGRRERRGALVVRPVAGVRDAMLASLLCSAGMPSRGIPGV